MNHYKKPALQVSLIAVSLLSAAPAFAQEAEDEGAAVGLLQGALVTALEKDRGRTPRASSWPPISTTCITTMRT